MCVLITIAHKFHFSIRALGSIHNEFGYNDHPVLRVDLKIIDSKKKRSLRPSHIHSLRAVSFVSSLASKQD